VKVFVRFALFTASFRFLFFLPSFIGGLGLRTSPEGFLLLRSLVLKGLGVVELFDRSQVDRLPLCLRFSLLLPGGATARPPLLFFFQNSLISSVALLAFHLQRLTRTG